MAAQSTDGLLRQIIELAKEKGLRIATAESCTGGMIAARLTDIPGSSSVFERGFVTYSNEAKIEMLGVRTAVLLEHGAVSAPVSKAMAEGALSSSNADLSVAVTGIAGPGGETDGKPVGLVHLATANRNGPLLHREMRYGDLGRAGIREATVLTGLEMLFEQLKTD
ncbi:CinA family protein [Coralliovum pocilloporae]|uniref:CinA family protein n=1 Tax=Coralliovum pocilloporae TaxID=3066369 RepID=UPI003306BB9A